MYIYQCFLSMASKPALALHRCTDLNICHHASPSYPQRWRQIQTTKVGRSTLLISYCKVSHFEYVHERNEDNYEIHTTLWAEMIMLIYYMLPMPFMLIYTFQYSAGFRNETIMDNKESWLSLRVTWWQGLLHEWCHLVWRREKQRYHSDIYFT